MRRLDSEARTTPATCARLALCGCPTSSQAELGIGPLGHRAALLQGIEELRSTTSEFVLDLAAHFGARRAEASPVRGGGGGGGVRPASRGGGVRPASPGGCGAWPSPERDKGKRPRSAPALRNRQPAAGAVPGDAFLGPAAGKVTVQEQRAKLLFELSRAQVGGGVWAVGFWAAKRKAVWRPGAGPGGREHGASGRSSASCVLGMC